MATLNYIYARWAQKEAVVTDFRAAAVAFPSAYLFLNHVRTEVVVMRYCKFSQNQRKFQRKVEDLNRECCCLMRIFESRVFV
jgi:hypothetical protein